MFIGWKVYNLISALVPCSYCDLYSLQKSNLQMFAVELLFHEMFFLSHS